MFRCEFNIELIALVIIRVLADLLSIINAHMGTVAISGKIID